MRVAKYIQRLYTEGNTNQEAWAPLLVPLVELSGDDQDAANLAARGLAAAQAEGIDGVVDTVLAGGNTDTIDYLITGFEVRLAAGRGDKATVALLEKLSAAPGGNGKRAKKIAKKYAKKV